MTQDDAMQVLTSWFGTVPAPDLPVDEVRSRWFTQDPKFDAFIRRRFGTLVERALDGVLVDWETMPRTRLALVIVLDQFTRNIYRGDARAFTGDSKARAIVIDTIERGMDKALTLSERSFLYLPFEHAEDQRMQARSLGCFQALVDDATPECREYCARALEFAQRHKAVIDRFGRFPHRNAALGRDSTAKELEYLERTPGGF